MAEITVSKLTEATVEGDGAFDVLMRAMKAHLEIEFNKNRIRGPEYSQVYLGSLQVIMQNASAFLLNKDKAANEAALIAAQVELTQTQMLKTDAEIQLLNQQRTNAVAEYDVLVAQKCKLQAEYDLVLANVTKSNAELSLLNQKVVSERAQVTSLGVDADSVIGRQKSLYLAQTNGYSRDAEQKVAKLMADTWSARRMTDEGVQANIDNKLADSFVGRAVGKLLDGVGA